MLKNVTNYFKLTQAEYCKNYSGLFSLNQRGFLANPLPVTRSFGIKLPSEVSSRFLPGEAAALQSCHFNTTVLSICTQYPPFPAADGSHPQASDRGAIRACLLKKKKYHVSFLKSVLDKLPIRSTVHRPSGALRYALKRRVVRTALFSDSYHCCC